MEIKTDNVRLMLGDCLQRMAEIPAGSVDMVLTDPPYGMAFQSNRSKTGPRHAKIAGDDRLDPRFLWDAFRVLKDSGRLVSFCDWGTSCRWRTYIEDAGFKVKSQIIWDRARHGMGDLKGAFAPAHDVAWYATKGRYLFRNGRPKSIIRDSAPSAANDKGHPTCKPQGLMRELVEKLSSESEIVLDPFMGSGSTGVACASLGRSFVGIERDPKYFAGAVGRILNTREELLNG